MSKQTAAKKARRKKRQSARNVRWLPDELQAEVVGIARITEEIAPRGWEYDDEFSGDEFITWYFPPSGVELAEDDVREPVTRIWVSDPEQAQLVLVGTGEDGFVHGLTVDQLFANLDAIEAYRVGDTPPEF
ncbi:hypothetical protein [Mycobacterium sp. OTB74]|uniref:hypothetical protein n=1 Tax=Mycobacterium sp. OTB74 TaxID=1853452 RepID=UPI002474F506|nr:hypothetical protein [Mycobacterium sp. OTB74]MDH6243852.1 hypothetical protein [Mycobacterium sp. OTB74]